MTDPAHVFFSGGAPRVARQCAVLQLWRQELQAAGSGGHALPHHQPLVRSVCPLVVPPYIHGVAVRPLLGGEGAGVSLTIRHRVMRGGQRMSVTSFDATLSWVQGIWRLGLF